MKTKRKEDDRRIPYYYYSIVTVACISCYSNTITADFVYDDRQAIVTNPDVIGSSWLSMFQNDFWGNPMWVPGSHKSYRPLTIITFRLQYILHGLQPHLFHLGNLALHSINACLVLSLATRFLDKEWSVLSALLFSVHSINSEAVCSVVGRADLLSNFFILLSFKTNKNSLLVLLAVLGVLSKETSIVIVPLAMARKAISGASKGRDLLELAVAAGILSYLRLAVNNFQSPRFSASDNPIAWEASWTTRAMTFAYLPVFHLYLLVFPNKLSFDWSMGSIPPIHSVLDGRFLVSILVYMLLFRLFRFHPLLTAWILAPLIFTTNILAYVGFVVAERLIYLSTAPFCILLGKMFPRGHLAKQAFIGILLVYSGRTWYRSIDWRTEESLFISAIGINPAKAHANLGYVYASQKRHSEALKHYKLALSHRRNMADVWYNMGILSEGHESIRYYQTALKYRPGFAAAHLNLGLLQWEHGQKNESFGILSNCLNLDGSGVKFYRVYQNLRVSCGSNLAGFLMRDRRYLEAIKVLHKTISIASSPSLYNTLGECHLHLNDFEAAEGFFKKSLEMDPEHINAHLTLTELFRRQNRTVEAHKEYSLARRLAPKSAPILYNLAVTAMRSESYSTAEKYFQEALQLDGSHVASLKGLADLWRVQGRLKECQKLYEKVVQLTPKDASAHANFGAILHLLGSFDRALGSYETALTLNPNDVICIENREKLKRKMNRTRRN